MVSIFHCGFPQSFPDCSVFHINGLESSRILSVQSHSMTFVDAVLINPRATQLYGRGGGNGGGGGGGRRSRFSGSAERPERSRLSAAIAVIVSGFQKTRFNLPLPFPFPPYFTAIVFSVISWKSVETLCKIHNVFPPCSESNCRCKCINCKIFLDSALILRVDVDFDSPTRDLLSPV